MKLFHREFGGKGHPIVVLHGLFGSSRNWISTGRFLASYGKAFGLDLRNHGRSPHSSSNTLADLTADLGEWIKENLDDPPVLMGHSMGGLCAMAFAMESPDRLEGLVVVDIAPGVEPVDHSRELAALSLDISGCLNRAEIDRLMRPVISEAQIRRFLQMNAVRSAEGFRWQPNVPALSGADAVAQFRTLAGSYAGPTLFTLGEKSSYAAMTDKAATRDRFPRAVIATIPEGDHWLHHSAAPAFRREVGRFLESLKL
jgi:pimeloyl-ACP methyl ester carboxylesterase